MPKPPYSLSSLGLVFLALLALIGSLSYIIVGLPISVRIIVVILSLLGAYGLRGFFKKEPTENKPTPAYSFLTRMGLAIYGLVLIAAIFQLFHHQSDRPLISPWDIIPSSHFLFYGLSSFCLLFLLPRLKTTLSLILTILHYGWSFSIVLIIYTIGYGFDPFIHQATVKAIEELGRVSPITPYYLGQYSLITIAHTLFGSTIEWWDKILVPALAAILLPLVLYKKLKDKFSLPFLIIILLLLLPFSIFIVTTPQNLAYLLLILVIIWSLKISNTGDLIIMSLLSLMALLTQPIAGLPALLFTLYTIGITKFNVRYHSFITASFLIILTISLPLAFYFFTHQTYNQPLSFSWPPIGDLFSFLIPHNPIKEIFYLDLTYFFSAGRGLLYAFVILSGVIIAFSQKKVIYLKRYGLPAIALLVSALISSAIDFHFLIDYERYDYPQRLIIVAVIFALPFFIISLEKFLLRLQETSFFIRLSWGITLAAFLTASFYLSYPRFDHYYNSHGYATSGADITAVRWINEDSGNRPYIVLANQQVSAAAIQQFGFARYYNNLFYYPVPTGGPLYQYYLELVKKPTRASVVKAMDLAGVNEAYVVLNDYWWAADKLGPELAAIADTSITLANGDVQVFGFKKK